MTDLENAVKGFELISTGNDFIYPDNILDCLDDIHYHHHEKDCETIKLTYKDEKGMFLDRLYCLTHDKICDITGWEKGWYLGTNSKKIFRKYEKINF